MVRTRATREQTRQKVLAAAFEVFSERGIAGASLDQVAARAGLTKGAVYSSFSSKNELVFALMEEQIANRIETSFLDLEESVTAHDAAQRIGEVVVQEIASSRGWHRLLAEFAAAAHRDESIREKLQQQRLEVRATITRLVSHMADVYKVELPLPAEDLAVLLLALGNGLALESDIEPDGVRPDLFAATFNAMSLAELARLLENMPSLEGAAV